MKKTNRGITLIALIITIVVMLILVGVVVSTTINSNLINKVKTAKGQWQEAEGEDSNISKVTIGGVEYNNINEYMQTLCEHEYGEWTVVKEPTLAEDGERYRTCTKCEVKQTETTKVEECEENAHTDFDWVIDTEATCVAKGSKHQTCTTCGKTVTEEIEIDEDNHDLDENGACTREGCDYVEESNSGSVQVELADGTKVTLTKENVATYLGKIVTNYTGQTAVNGYTVSDTYRLYYVDFDNKYGDGAGTVYLKAECPSSEYRYALPNTDTSSADAENIKIKNLNPALYGITPSTPSGSSDVISPSTTNDNMKAVTWLTNTTNWAGLADTTHTEISGKINYIVGAPSLEMMMDSYNTYYEDELTGTTSPDFSDITPGERRKLFYRYQSNSTGYQVGPNADGDIEYSTYTSVKSVYTDSDIGSMYYPGDGNYYWLASPSARDSISVMFVDYGFGGSVNYGDYNFNYAFCPLVSLDSSVQLKLEN